MYSLHFSFILSMFILFIFINLLTGLFRLRSLTIHQDKPTPLVCLFLPSSIYSTFFSSFYPLFSYPSFLSSLLFLFSNYIQGLRPVLQKCKNLKTLVALNSSTIDPVLLDSPVFSQVVLFLSQSRSFVLYSFFFAFVFLILYIKLIYLF